MPRKSSPTPNFALSSGGVSVLDMSRISERKPKPRAVPGPMRAYGGFIEISSPNAVPAGSSMSRAAKESSEIVICGSVDDVPAVCSNESLIFGSVTVTSALAGSSSSIPSGVSLAPRRNGRCSVAASMSRSRWKTVVGASCAAWPGVGCPCPMRASAFPTAALEIWAAGAPPGPPITVSTAGLDARGAVSRKRMAMSGKSQKEFVSRAVRWSTFAVPPKLIEAGGVNRGGFAVRSALKRAIPQIVTPASSNAVSISCTKRAETSSCSGSPIAAPPRTYGVTTSTSARLPILVPLRVDVGW